ncbi:hypothetical protein T08_3249 [Trichinella sp. T8]|nr:hypothetical protein T08_3249 [Trichinella sp. T8]
MTSESNCWLTFLLNRIYERGWINKSEALRKQKESDEQHNQAEKHLKLLQMHTEVDIALFDVSICAPFKKNNNFCEQERKKDWKD